MPGFDLSRTRSRSEEKEGRGGTPCQSTLNSDGLAQAQRFDHSARDPTGHVEPVIALITAQGIARGWAEGSVNCAIVITFPGQCALHITHLRVPVVLRTGRIR